MYPLSQTFAVIQHPHSDKHSNRKINSIIIITIYIHDNMLFWVIMPKYTSVASCIAVVLLYCMMGVFSAYRAINKKKRGKKKTFGVNQIWEYKKIVLQNTVLYWKILYWNVKIHINQKESTREKLSCRQKIQCKKLWRVQMGNQL